MEQTDDENVAEPIVNKPVIQPVVELSLSQIITETFLRFDYPLSAKYIADLTLRTKKEINSELSKMKTVERLEMSPPLYRLRI